MHRIIIVMLAALPLCACGLAETAASGATAATANAAAAQQGQQTEKRVQVQVDAAQQLATDQLHAADRDSTQ